MALDLDLTCELVLAGSLRSVMEVFDSGEGREGLEKLSDLFTMLLPSHNRVGSKGLCLSSKQSTGIRAHWVTQRVAVAAGGLAAVEAVGALVALVAVRAMSSL